MAFNSNIWQVITHRRFKHKRTVHFFAKRITHSLPLSLVLSLINLLLIHLCCLARAIQHCIVGPVITSIAVENTHVCTCNKRTHTHTVINKLVCYGRNWKKLLFGRWIIINLKLLNGFFCEHFFFSFSSV